MLNNINDNFLRRIVVNNKDIALSVQLLINNISEELNIELTDEEYLKTMKEVGFPKIKLLKISKARVGHYSEHNIINLPNALEELIASANATFNAIEDYIYMIIEDRDNKVAEDEKDD